MNNNFILLQSNIIDILYFIAYKYDKSLFIRILQIYIFLTKNIHNRILKYILNLLLNLLLNYVKYILNLYSFYNIIYNILILIKI